MLLFNPSKKLGRLRVVWLKCLHLAEGLGGGDWLTRQILAAATRNEPHGIILYHRRRRRQPLGRVPRWVPLLLLQSRDLACKSFAQFTARGRLLVIFQRIARAQCICVFNVRPGFIQKRRNFFLLQIGQQTLRQRI